MKRGGRKLLLTFVLAVLVGIIGTVVTSLPALGQSTLSICTESTSPCPSGGCQPDEHCGVIGSTGRTCGCIPNKPWPQPY